MGISSYIIRINYIAKTDSKGTLSYFLFNGHGDVVQTVDEAGKVQNQYDYDIWGNPVLTVETSSNAIRYAGEFMDSETGLYYLRARYYDTYTGRFTTEDSYWGEDENPLSLNLYAYCYNNPISYTDPTGHITDWEEDFYEGHQGKASDYTSDGMRKPDGHDIVLSDETVSTWSSGSSKATFTTNGITQTMYVEDDGKAYNSDGNVVGKLVDGHITVTDSMYNALFGSGSGGTSNATVNVRAGDHVTSITTPDGSNATINSSGSIKTINTGDNSNTTINNRGFIDTINTGKDSSLLLYNYGEINKVNIGESSSAIISNYGKIGALETNTKNYIGVGNGDYYIAEDGYAYDINTVFDIINQNITNPNGFMLLASKSNSSEVTKWSVTKNFFGGFVDAGKSAIEGLVGIFAHPIETVKGLGFLYNASKVGTEENGLLTFILTQAAMQAWDDYNAGDDNKKAKMIGRVVGEIVFAVAGAKGINFAVDGVKALTKSGEFSKILSKIGKGTTTIKEASEIINRVSIALETIYKAGFTDSELATFGVKTETQITCFANLLNSGADKKLIRSLAKRLNLTFSEFERFGLTSTSALDNFASQTIDFDGNLIQHIFKGEINGNLEVVGYHYEGFSNAIAKVEPGTKTQVNMFGAYNANVVVGGLSKEGMSTFFPKTWSPKQVVKAISDAYMTRVKVGGNLYRGALKNGMKIEMRLDSLGRIVTAYPVY